MTQEYGNPFEAIRDAAQRAMVEVAESALADMKQLISIPVEYEENYVVRSLPGEAPRTETGEYLKSWEMTTGTPGGEPEAGIESFDPKGRELEVGTDKVKPRPHVSVIAERWTPEVAPAVASAIEAATGSGETGGI